MVKCKECGYLAVRDRESYLLIDAGDDYRERGTIPNRYDDKGMNPHSVHEKQPICFVRSYDLRDEIKSSYGKDGIVKDDTGYVLEVISRERACSEFTEWKQGFTPKEHREMLDRERMLEREAQRIKTDRKWQTQQQIRLVLIAGIFTILGAIIGGYFAILR